MEISDEKAWILLVSSMLLSTAGNVARLNAEQLKSEYVGHTLSFKTKKGATGKSKLRRNGTSRLWNTNFDPKSDKGT